VVVDRIEAGNAVERLAGNWRGDRGEFGEAPADMGPAEGELNVGLHGDAQAAPIGLSDTGAVFEAKFMLPWSFPEEAAAEKHMAQLQHNMWVTNATTAVLSIITGGGKWVEIDTG
jgi:hypothetical protein